MGSTHGTIASKDNQFNSLGLNELLQVSGDPGPRGVPTNQFYWRVGSNVSILTGTNGATIFSPNFQFEDESWQFVLEKVTLLSETPYVARDSFLLKLTNQTENSKAVFHVQLNVAYRDMTRYRIMKSGICKLDFGVKTAEYKFIPEEIAANWNIISKNVATLQQAGIKVRFVDWSQWMFSCQIFKSDKKESPFTINEEAEFEGLVNNSEWKLKSMKRLQDDLKNLLHGGKKSDVVFKVGGREYKAHRSILSARSDFFAAMFDHDTSENQTGVVTIEDCDPDAFQCLLQYIYTGDTCFSPESIANLYTVADRYQVLELKEECTKHIKNNLTVASFCDVARISLRHPGLSLAEIIGQYFTKNASDIISTYEWETFMQENPTFCNGLFYKTLKSTR